MSEHFPPPLAPVAGNIQIIVRGYNTAASLVDRRDNRTVKGGIQCDRSLALLLTRSFRVYVNYKHSAITHYRLFATGVQVVLLFTYSDGETSSHGQLTQSCWMPPSSVRRLTSVGRGEGGTSICPFLCFTAQIILKEQIITGWTRLLLLLVDSLHPQIPGIYHGEYSAVVFGRVSEGGGKEFMKDRFLILWRNDGHPCPEKRQNKLLRRLFESTYVAGFI